MVKKPAIQKAWWKSKTVWAAIITIALGVLGAVATFMQQLDSKYLWVIVAAIGTLNLALRKLTDKPIGAKDVLDFAARVAAAKKRAEEEAAAKEEDGEEDDDEPEAEPPKSVKKRVVKMAEPSEAVKLKVVDLEEKEDDGEPHALGDIQEKEEEPPTEKDELDAMMDDIEKKTLKNK